MIFDPDLLDNFWNAEYFPEVIAVDKARQPSIDFIKKSLGRKSEIIPVPIDCKDGFQEVFYARPEAFLDKEIRLSQSVWGFIDDAKQLEIVKRLGNDLKTGERNRKYGHFRKQQTFTCAIKIIVSKHD